MRPHTTHFDSCGCEAARLEAARVTACAVLATVRAELTALYSLLNRAHGPALPVGGETLLAYWERWLTRPSAELEGLAGLAARESAVGVPGVADAREKFIAAMGKDGKP